MHEEEHNIEPIETPASATGLKRLWMKLLCSTMAPWRALKTHGEPHVRGLEHMVQDGIPVDGPYQWILQHQSWDDIANYPFLWDKTGYPNFAAVARSDYFPQIPPLSWATRTFMQTTGLFYIIQREDENGSDPDTRKRRNREHMERMKRDLQRGIHIAIVPQGTSKNDGRIGKLKPGCYYTSHVRTDNTLHTVKNFVIGNTYDFLSAPDERNLVFFNIGRPFYYEPLAREDDEDDKAYVRRDGDRFLGRVRERMLDLNTITMAQLGSIFVYRQGHHNATWRMSDIEHWVYGIAEILAAEKIAVDNELLKPERHDRLEGFMTRLLKEGYVVETNGAYRINRARTHHFPTDQKSYRNENPLRFSFNRIQEVALARQHIRSILGRDIAML